MPSQTPELHPRSAPPLGIEPRYLWLQARFDALHAAIKRYRDANLEPQQQWLMEVKQLEVDLPKEQAKRLASISRNVM